MQAQYYYFGHHKCASRYVIDICNKVSALVHLDHIEYHQSDIPANKLAEKLRNNGKIFTYISNAKKEYAEIIPGQFKGFHIIRDPRDIIVSAYFSHKYSHATDEYKGLIKHRENLEQLTQEEGLILEINSRVQNFDDFLNWNYNQPHILELRYEDMILSPYRTFVKVFTHLELLEETALFDRSSIKLTSSWLLENLKRRFSGKKRSKITVPELLTIVYLNEFEKKTKGRKEGEENQKSHYRKGIAGDWKNYFTPQVKQEFKERYNDLILKLEYETSADW
jgi:hypothetical protein